MRRPVAAVEIFTADTPVTFNRAYSLHLNHSFCLGRQLLQHQAVFEPAVLHALVVTFAFDGVADFTAQLAQSIVTAVHCGFGRVQFFHGLLPFLKLQVEIRQLREKRQTPRERRVLVDFRPVLSFQKFFHHGCLFLSFVPKNPNTHISLRRLTILLAERSSTCANFRSKPSRSKFEVIIVSLFAP